MTDEELKQIEERQEKNLDDHHVHGKSYPPVLDDIAALLAEVKDLNELLNEYGRHQEGCNATANVGNSRFYACKCGYEREVENR